MSLDVWMTISLGMLATRVFAQSVYTPYTFSALAGSGFIGSSDGTGGGAQFSFPGGVAVDSSGNIFVADTENNTVREVSPTGQVTTLAGKAGTSGAVDGTGNVARFNAPWAVALDNAGNIYVADAGNNTIRLVRPSGTVTTLAGVAGSFGSADGPASQARFNAPHGVAVDNQGDVYVADYGNGTIRKLTPEGMVATVAGSAGNFGSTDGSTYTARFGVCSTNFGTSYCAGPGGVAVDSVGNVYVSDTGNNTIRKVTPNGFVSTLAGLASNAGSADETGSAARFNQPQGIAVDSAGNLFVADSYNGTIRKVTAAGVVTTLGGVAGTTGNGGTTAVVPSAAEGSGSAARFRVPYGVAVDPAGDLYIADSWDNAVWKGRQVAFTPYTFSTIAGNAGASTTDGPGYDARFNSPYGIAGDRFGNLYITDYNNFTIRKISPAGIVTTLAGSPGVSGNVDGTGNTALFGGCGSSPFSGTFCAGPRGVAVDSAGNVYIADAPNQTIRKVSPAGVVTTLAGLPLNDLGWPGPVGPPNIGATDGQGSAARFYNPSGLAVDNSDNVFVADTDNSTIRKITPEGLVTTFAGLALNTGSADGLGSAARFNGPTDVAVDSAGNVYVADTGNFIIRKITPDGEVTTFAGSVGQSGVVDGAGSSARFDSPIGLAVDTAGNIYVVDSNTIRKVTPAGVVTSLAGCATCGSGSADGTGNAALFNSPQGVTTDNGGNVYVADQNNNTIRKVTQAGVVTTIAGLPPADYSAGPDGTGLNAWFYDPSGVAVDSAGNVYVADTDNETIRKITPGGVVTILAGSTGNRGNTNATGSAARFSSPTSVGADSAGNVYVADYDNSLIRKVTPAGEVTTLAAFAGYGVAVDSSANVYATDTDNNTVLMISPAGVVTTLAGVAGRAGSVDGTGTNALFSAPAGIAVDGDGNLYVADLNNATIRKITPDGAVTTLAGCASCPYGSFDGTGTNALFTAPWGVAVDRAGNVFVADYGNFTIRKVTPAGEVTTVAGLAGAYGADDGTGDAARFGGCYTSYFGFFPSTVCIGPRGIAIDTAGYLYVADYQNGTIRKGYPENVPPLVSASSQSLGLNAGQFALELAGPTGQLLVVEASADLLSWSPVWTNVFDGVAGDVSTITFSDPDSTAFSKRFYRAHTP